ncbi:restriction endonuclease subunit S [Flavobacterium sp. F-65]|uniref:Restriction endonuclease subunit S n=1 Tax=Flavobacterium pisciphilum TaxID=2893755 RepID=A0ABS8MXQ9_9FLAO|nr:restriction endonuclease subunit S [Flavobacterium sp. F-65]MCC9073568.1 restriction endonuclease subunit S [Flavobacterium sp. F-65]
MEKQLPKNWVEIPFTDIFDINGGTQPPKSVFIDEPRDGYIRLLQIRDFGKKPVPTYIPDTGKLMTCQKDDILIARYGASIGRIVTGMEGSYNVALAKVDIPQNMNKSFVKWILKSNLFQEPILSIQRTAQNGFNKTDLASIYIPLPPLNEQNRIVTKLECLFDQLESIKTSMATIPVLLKDFRQQVLTQAVTGKLTESWRVGKELEEWKEMKVGNLIDSIQAGKSFLCLETSVSQGQVGLVKISAVTWNQFNQKETKTVEDKSRINNAFFIKKGDFLISRANTLELVGSSVIVHEIDFDIMLSDKVWRINFKEELNKKYLNYYLKTKKGRSEIESRATGNQLSMRNISQNSFKDIDIKLPSLKEKIEIIRSIESLFTKADAIEKQYETLKKKIDTLPQAILHKAFKGELVEQLDTDGDARELLQQIQELKGLSIKVEKKKVVTKKVKL